MELVSLYNKANKIDRLHYITMESVVNRVFENYKMKPYNFENMNAMAYDFQQEMRSRLLDKFFQLELSIDKGTIKIKVHEINYFHKPKECVVWN